MVWSVVPAALSCAFMRVDVNGPRLFGLVSTIAPLRFCLIVASYLCLSSFLPLLASAERKQEKPGREPKGNEGAKGCGGGMKG